MHKSWLWFATLITSVLFTMLSFMEQHGKSMAQAYAKNVADSTASSVRSIDIEKHDTSMPVGFGSRVKDHLKRFWKLHILIGAVSSAVITILLAFAVYPKLAQTQINQATFVVSDVIISNPTSTSMDMNCTATLLSSSIFAPHFDGFNASVYLLGSSTPFVTDIVIPSFVGHNGSVMSIHQHIELTPETTNGLGEFSADFLTSNQSFSFHFVGNTHMQLGGLPRIELRINETISIKGLNNLEGTTLTGLNVDLSAKPNAFGGIMTTGQVSIPNQSAFTLPLGNVTQSLYVKSSNGSEVLIGNSTIPDLVLRPGTHNYNIVSSTEPIAFMALIKEPDYSCGKLPVTVVEHGSTVDGEYIPYFSHAVQTSNLTMQLDLGSALRQAGMGSLLGKDCPV